jgi:hypothetical protein
MLHRIGSSIAMTDDSTGIDPPFVISGTVKSYEASGGSENSQLFSFHLANSTNEASFQLRTNTPPGMFAAMAVIVAAAYAAGPGARIEVTSYERLASGVYLANLIRGV